MIFLIKCSVSEKEVIYNYQINQRGEMGAVRLNIKENKLFWDKAAMENKEIEPECFHVHAFQKILEYNKNKVFPENELVCWY